MRKLSLYEMYILVFAAVQERGEAFVYPEEWRRRYPGEQSGGPCRYFNDDGTPSCIIGLAMSYRGNWYPSNNEGPAEQELTYIGSPQAIRFASTVQAVQDSGRPWGVALLTATVKHQEELRAAGVNPQLRYFESIPLRTNGDES